MSFDVMTLSRIQFAMTIMFHYLFPPLSIGLGALMVLMEGMYLRTRNPQYHAMTKFWSRIFAVNFAMGVASGIVMEFQFGTNWSRYARYVGDVFGSALAAEGIFAFFLESGFLAVLVFGWDRVSPRMHFFATLMVSFGSIFSAVWIVVANSWQQTPAGHHIVHAGTPQERAEIVDFWAMVFNPSSMHRLTHVLLGAFILGAFFVMSISAYYLLRRRHEEFARKSFTLALVFGSVFALAELISGHLQARAVARNQPAKLAAFEGHFHNSADGGTAMYLCGVPDQEGERVDYGLAIPGMLSFLVHDDFNTPVQSLDTFAPEDRPPVAVPFQCYHLMIALGVGFVVLTLFALWLLWRGTLFQTRWLLWIFVVAVIGAFAANQAGWVAAEVGRQPWIVYGHLRTSDAWSRSVVPEQVMASIVMFSVVYAFLFAVWVYVLNSKIHHGPDAVESVPQSTSALHLLDAAARLKVHSGYSLTAPAPDALSPPTP